MTPSGSPDAEKVTGCVVPLTKVAAIEDSELVEPWTTVKLLGEGVERLKSKAVAATVNERGVVRLTPPPVPMIVTVTVPRLAVAVAEKEMVTVHAGLQGLFMKLAVTPVGSPVAESVTS